MINGKLAAPSCEPHPGGARHQPLGAGLGDRCVKATCLPASGGVIAARTPQVYPDAGRLCQILGEVCLTARTTIPKEIRTALAIAPGDRIVWEVAPGGKAIVRRAQTKRSKVTVPTTAPGSADVILAMTE
jgi:hypothetical protein